MFCSSIESTVFESDISVSLFISSVSVFSADGNEHDLDVSVFNEIAKHQSEIQKPRGLWIECKVRKTEGKEENKMPAVPSQDDWDW